MLRKTKILTGLMALALFMGGCIVEPLDEEPAEETGSVSAGVSASPDELGSSDDPGFIPAIPVKDGMRTGQSSGVPDIGSHTEADPTKPQPDPWDGVKWQSEDSVSNH